MVSCVIGPEGAGCGLAFYKRLLEVQCAGAVEDGKAVSTIWQSIEIEFDLSVHAAAAEDLSISVG